MKIWRLFRKEKEERHDCDTCKFYVEEEGSGCIPFSRGSHEEARELCKADRHRRGEEQEDCEACSSKAYRENDIRRMCKRLNEPLWKMAVIVHPAETGSWDCIYWESKKESEKIGKELVKGEKRV